MSSAIAGVGIGGVVDGISDLLGMSFLLELVSNDLDRMYTNFFYFLMMLRDFKIKIRYL